VVDLSPISWRVRSLLSDQPALPRPTTAAIFGDALYLVNARFDEIPGGQASPTDTFEAVRVPIE